MEGGLQDFFSYLEEKMQRVGKTGGLDRDKVDVGKDGEDVNRRFWK